MIEKNILEREGDFWNNLRKIVEGEVKKDFLEDECKEFLGKMEKALEDKAFLEAIFSMRSEDKKNLSITEVPSAFLILKKSEENWTMIPITIPLIRNEKEAETFMEKLEAIERKGP
jgi:hypothetical protein